MEEIHYSCSISILKISLTIINFSEKIFSFFLSSLNSFLIMSGKQIILHKDFCSIYVKTYRIAKKTNCSKSACYLSRISCTIPFSSFSKETRNSKQRQNHKVVNVIFHKGIRMTRYLTKRLRPNTVIYDFSNFSRDTSCS